jgi:hypothetical protein
MTCARRLVAACGLAVLLGALAGPVTGAMASKASIKEAFRSYSSKIAVAEGHTLTAVGEYKTTKNAAPVEEAITNSIAVIGGLRSKVAHQSAKTPKVKAAKAKFVKGLKAIIVSYEKLKAAFADKASNPEAAQAEATKALAALKSGRKLLGEAVKLLG